jgi:hypothetical protein
MRPGLPRRAGEALVTWASAPVSYGTLLGKYAPSHREDRLPERDFNTAAFGVPPGRKTRYPGETSIPYEFSQEGSRSFRRTSPLRRPRSRNGSTTVSC